MLRNDSLLLCEIYCVVLFLFIPLYKIVKMTTYQRIIAKALAVPELLNAHGQVVDLNIIKTIGVSNRIWLYWKKSDFENINKPNIDKLLLLLGCNYEDIFTPSPNIFLQSL